MKILVLGSRGMVGSSVSSFLEDDKQLKVIKSSRDDTNLFLLEETKDLISKTNPDVIVNAAAKVGGILANNTYRTGFILNNLKININIIESIIDHPNIKLINLGSSCIYPLGASIPISESALMSGPLEPTNSPYAMAKLSAIEMGDAISKEHGHKVLNLMPTNLYGQNDNFSATESHVIPGLIYRMHNAKINNENNFTVWGTGKPLREFLHVDDLSKAIHFLVFNETDENLLNVGSNEEVSIKELVYKIKNIIDFKGELVFDDTKPDGNPRKLLDSSKLRNLGWEPTITLEKGLEATYDWFKNNF
jgi:GDP-L-fucose synthase